MALSVMKHPRAVLLSAKSYLRHNFSRDAQRREKGNLQKPSSAWLRLLKSNAGGRGPYGSSMSSEQEQL